LSNGAETSRASRNVEPSGRTSSATHDNENGDGDKPTGKVTSAKNGAAELELLLSPPGVPEETPGEDATHRCNVESFSPC
jgi:hypothetical protein